MEEIFKGIKNNTPTPEAFNLYQEALLSSYESQAYNLPVFLASETLKNIIFSDFPTSSQQLKAMKKISYDEYQTFSKELLKKTYFQSFYYGNISAEEAKQNISQLKNILGSSPTLLGELTEPQVLCLADKEGPFQVNLPSKLQGNAAILLIDHGSPTFVKNGAQLILNSALAEAFFDELRTKQQTGYIAQSFPLKKTNRLFQCFAVQSSTHYPQELLARFELFIEQYIRDFTQNISAERFEKLKSSMVTDLQRPSKNMQEEALFHYSNAYRYKYDFARREKMIEATKNLSYEDFVTISTDFLSRKNVKRIGVLVEGKPTEAKSFKYNKISQDLLKQSGTYVSYEE
jgi:insulysin